MNLLKSKMHKHRKTKQKEHKTKRFKKPADFLRRPGGDSLVQELWADMADVRGRKGAGSEWSAVLSSLSWYDPVAPKAPLQLQVLQLLPQLLPLLLLLLLTETTGRGQTSGGGATKTKMPGEKYGSHLERSYVCHSAPCLQTQPHFTEINSFMFDLKPGESLKLRFCSNQMFCPYVPHNLYSRPWERDKSDVFRSDPSLIHVWS